MRIKTLPTRKTTRRTNKPTAAKGIPVSDPGQMQSIELTDDEVSRLDLLEMMFSIYRLMKDAYPSGLEPRRHFDYMMDRDWDNEPTMQDLTKLFEMWKALPTEEKRRIYKGWLPPKEPENRADYMHYLKSCSLFPAVVIGTGNITPTDRGLYAESCIDPDASIRPVAIIVRVGTEKTAVLRFLEEARDAVALHWNKIVAVDPEDRADLRLPEPKL
jgi:hypothetical protein